MGDPALNCWPPCLSVKIPKQGERYAEEKFKVRAVQLMKESSKPIRKLAEELGVSGNNLYNWRKQLQEKANNAFSNQPRFDEKELEISHLKARVYELEEEREILKKAAVFFAKEESQRSTR